jgi:hypothetical protein
MDAQPAEDVAGPYDFEDAEDLASAVFQALGAASVCWEFPEKAGIFDSTRAKAIGDGLLAWIARNNEQQ